MTSETDPPARPTSSAPVILYICSTCKGEDWSEGAERAGERLFRSAAQAVADKEPFELRAVECLGNCSRGLSAALVCEGGWSYVFGGLGENHAADLATGARLMAEGGTGPLVWRGRPDCLKKGMVARIPPRIQR